MTPIPLVDYVVRSLVENQDEVHISEIPGSEETIIELRVADSDIGKVIGKNGSVARALRTLIQAVGAREKRSYVLEIID